MLNKRDEEFCQAIVNGLSYSDAFILAYKPSTDKKTTIAPKASRLANSEAIKARIRQLQERIADKFVDSVSISKQEVLSDLVALAKDPDIKPSDRIKSYNLICSISGYSISKIESTSTNTSISVSMDQLTINELLKLASMPQVLESPAIVDGLAVDPDSGS